MIIGQKPIKIIGWWLILWPCFPVLQIAFIFSDPKGKEIYMQAWQAEPFLYFIMYFGYLVNLSSGIAILKRKIWGRYSFMIWGLLYFCVGIYTKPSIIDLIPWFAFYLSFGYFLFRPQAIDYFNENAKQLDND